jgi:hypothetical protein
MLSRPHYLRARIADVLAEFPNGGSELCDSLVDLFDEVIDETIADFHRELPEMPD